MDRALSFARDKPGSNIAARMAIMAMSDQHLDEGKRCASGASRFSPAFGELG